MGDGRDKGHLIANSIGGEIVGGETNVVPRRRDVNRGWSREGRLFRLIEIFPCKNPGIMYFHRAIYLSESDSPDFLEVGIVRSDNSSWIECFDNRLWLLTFGMRSRASAAVFSTIKHH